MYIHSVTHNSHHNKGVRTSTVIVDQKITILQIYYKFESSHVYDIARNTAQKEGNTFRRADVASPAEGQIDVRESSAGRGLPVLSAADRKWRAKNNSRNDSLPCANVQKYTVSVEAKGSRISRRRFELRSSERGVCKDVVSKSGQKTNGHRRGETVSFKI